MAGSAALEDDSTAGMVSPVHTPRPCTAARTPRSILRTPNRGSLISPRHTCHTPISSSWWHPHRESLVGESPQTPASTDALRAKLAYVSADLDTERHRVTEYRQLLGMQAPLWSPVIETPVNKETLRAALRAVTTKVGAVQLEVEELEAKLMTLTPSLLGRCLASTPMSTPSQVRSRG